MNRDFIAKHWYASIYEQMENQTYDVEFLLRVLGPKPLNILEIGCGGGRIAVPLAEAGHFVTGLDADEYALFYREGICTWISICPPTRPPCSTKLGKAVIFLAPLTWAPLEKRSLTEAYTTLLPKSVPAPNTGKSPQTAAIPFLFRTSGTSTSPHRERSTAGSGKRAFPSKEPT